MHPWKLESESFSALRQPSPYLSTGPGSNFQLYSSLSHSQLMSSHSWASASYFPFETIYFWTPFYVQLTILSTYPAISYNLFLNAKMPVWPASGQSGNGMKICRYRDKGSQLGIGTLRDRTKMPDIGMSMPAALKSMPDTQRAVNVNAEMRTEADGGSRWQWCCQLGWNYGRITRKGRQKKSCSEGKNPVIQKRATLCEIIKERNFFVLSA
jgi:hypothetical protein